MTLVFLYTGLVVIQGILSKLAFGFGIGMFVFGVCLWGDRQGMELLMLHCQGFNHAGDQAIGNTYDVALAHRH
jgi:hypothetical protein